MCGFNDYIWEVNRTSLLEYNRDSLEIFDNHWLINSILILSWIEAIQANWQLSNYLDLSENKWVVENVQNYMDSAWKI